MHKILIIFLVFLTAPIGAMNIGVSYGNGSILVERAKGVLALLTGGQVNAPAASGTTPTSEKILAIRDQLVTTLSASQLEEYKNNLQAEVDASKKVEHREGLFFYAKDEETEKGIKKEIKNAMDAEIAARGTTSLAVTQEKAELKEPILGKKNNVTHHGAIFDAIYANDQARFESLCSDPMRYNKIRNEEKQTPVMVAAGQGHGKMVKHCIDVCKADLTKLDKHNSSVLHAAVVSNNPMLFHYVSDCVRAQTTNAQFSKMIDQKSSIGVTPLILATGKGKSKRIVEKLLEDGANPAITLDGATAFDLAEDDEVKDVFVEYEQKKKKLDAQKKQQEAVEKKKADRLFKELMQGKGELTLVSPKAHAQKVVEQQKKQAKLFEQKQALAEKKRLEEQVEKERLAQENKRCEQEQKKRIEKLQAENKQAQKEQEEKAQAAKLLKLAAEKKEQEEKEAASKKQQEALLAERAVLRAQKLARVGDIGVKQQMRLAFEQWKLLPAQEKKVIEQQEQQVQVIQQEQVVPQEVPVVVPVQQELPALVQACPIEVTPTSIPAVASVADEEKAELCDGWQLVAQPMPMQPAQVYGVPMMGCGMPSSAQIPFVPAVSFGYDPIAQDAEEDLFSSVGLKPEEVKLFKAVIASDFATLESMVKHHECSVNICDKDGVTPLMVATTCNNLGMVNFLVMSAGADVKAHNSPRADKPVERAAMANHYPILAALVAKSTGSLVSRYAINQLQAHHERNVGIINQLQAVVYQEQEQSKQREGLINQLQGNLWQEQEHNRQLRQAFEQQSLEIERLRHGMKKQRNYINHKK